MPSSTNKAMAVTVYGTLCRFAVHILFVPPCQGVLPYSSLLSVQEHLCGLGRRMEELQILRPKNNWAGF